MTEATNKSAPMEVAERVSAVRAHAIRHYEEDGWDFLVECWENAEIAKATEGATTAEEAIELIGRTLRQMDSIRSDIQSEAY
jgi:hypothetical protein